MQTISLPVLEAGEYAGGIWYYEPHTYQSYRYVLGRVGKHPLVCIGINPSTAQPGALDPSPRRSRAPGTIPTSNRSLRHPPRRRPLHPRPASDHRAQRHRSTRR